MTVTGGHPLPRSLALASSFVVAVGLLGCGPASEDETDASTDGDGATDDDAAVCTWPEDEPVDESPAATITIRNDGADPAFVLPFAGGCNYGAVAIDIDGAEVLWDRPGVTAPKCAEPDGLCFFGCSDGGDQGYLLAAGASVDVTWNRYVWAIESIPAPCQTQLECPNDLDDCRVRRAAGNVDYQVRVQVTDECPGEPDACAACMDDVCEVFVYEPGSIPVDRTFVGQGTLPDGVLVVIE